MTDTNENEAVVPDGEPQQAEAEKITDDTMIEIDGEQFSVADLRAGFMKNKDYTQKTQGLAKDREEVTAAAQAVKDQQEALNTMMADPDRLLDLAVASRKPQATNAPMADDDVLTVGTIRQMFAEERSKTENAAQAAAGAAEQARVLRDFEIESQTALQEAFRLSPALKKLPFIGDTLKKMSLDDKPQTVAEMKTAIVRAGMRYAKDQNLDVVADAPSSKIDGIEPPGGSLSPPPPNKSYIKGRNKIDFAEIDKDVTARIEALMKK